MSKKNSNRYGHIIVIIGLVAAVSGCKSKAEEPCVEPAQTSPSAQPAAGNEAATKTAQSVNSDADWCRACVVGPHGFMSCKRISQTDPSETQEMLRDKARIAACVDSGFTKERCPAEKVISVACKGDPPPGDERAAGTALLKALKNSGPLVLTDDPEAISRIKDKVADQGTAPAPPKSSGEGATATTPPPPADGASE